MIRFASPLPRNYDHIVKVFLGEDQQDKQVDGKRPDDVVPETPVEPNKVETTSPPEEAKATVEPVVEVAPESAVGQVESIAPTVDISVVAQVTQPEEPVPSQTPPQAEQQPQSEWMYTNDGPIPDEPAAFTVSVNMDKVQPKTKMGRSTVAALGGVSLSSSLPLGSGVVPVNPFTEKPKIVTPTLNHAQLLQANPTLNDDYLQQRQELLQSRQLQPQQTADDLKLADVKVDIPQAYLEQQRKEFEDQQAALLALRNQHQVVELKDEKAEKEVVLALPKQNDVPQRRMNINRARNILPVHKQVMEIQQALPPANMVQLVESLRVDQLKQLCAQRGLAIKGNKPDLIARLKAAGIQSVTY